MSSRNAYNLYKEKYGHLSDDAFPHESEFLGSYGMTKLEYVASQLLAAGYGTSISIVSKTALVKEAIETAEIFLGELAARDKKRREECEKEIEAAHARVETDSGNASNLS